MNRFNKIAGVLLAASSLAACSGTQVVQMSDGSRLEVASAGKGATEVAAWKFHDARTGKEAVGVRETDSMAARVVPGVAAAATGGLINMATAVKVQDMKKGQCGDGGCGSGSVAQVVLQAGAVTAGAVAEANSASGSTSQTASACGDPNGVCLGTMD